MAPTGGLSQFSPSARTQAQFVGLRRFPSAHPWQPQMAPTTSGARRQISNQTPGSLATAMRNTVGLVSLLFPVGLIHSWRTVPIDSPAQTNVLRLKPGSGLIALVPVAVRLTFTSSDPSLLIIPLTPWNQLFPGFLLQFWPFDIGDKPSPICADGPTTIPFKWSLGAAALTYQLVATSLACFPSQCLVGALRSAGAYPSPGLACSVSSSAPPWRLQFSNHRVARPSVPIGLQDP